MHLLPGQSTALSVLFICGEEDNKLCLDLDCIPQFFLSAVSPVEQCEDLTEEQLWSVLVRVLALTPVVLPFSSPGQSFKAAANQV